MAQVCHVTCKSGLQTVQRGSNSWPNNSLLCTLAQPGWSTEMLGSVDFWSTDDVYEKSTKHSDNTGNSYEQSWHEPSSGGLSWCSALDLQHSLLARSLLARLLLRWLIQSGALQVMSSASAIRPTPISTRRAARHASLRPMPSPTGRTPGDRSLVRLR